MTDAVTAVPESRWLVAQGWSLRAERVELVGDDGWRALIGIRRGLKLLVTGTGQAEHLQVEAWTGEPGQSDGVAVIDAGDSWRVARVAPCSCGEPGLDGVQLDKDLAGDELPALVDLLRELPWAGTVAPRSKVLRGNGLAAIDGPGTDPALSGPLYWTAWRGGSIPGRRGSRRSRAG